MKSGGGRWRDLAAALLLLAAALALGRQSLTQPYVRDDFECQNLPGHAWFGRQMAAGRLPLWCAEAGAGYPLYAEGQNGPLYLGNLPRALWPSQPWRAFNLTLLLHLAWAGLGLYANLRALGARRLAALAGGLAFMASGPLYARQVHINFFEGLCWLGWLGWGIERGLAGRGRGWLAAGAAFGMMILAGHQHPPLLAVLLAPVYVAGRYVCGPRPACRPRRALGGLLAAGLLGGLLGAALVLPLAELAPQSVRGGAISDAERTVLSLTPSGCYAFLLPQWFGSPFVVGDGQLRTFGLVLPQEWCPYLALTALGLWLASPLLGRRRERWLFVALAVAALALAFGRELPCYGWLAHLPGWSRVRGPGRLLSLFVYGAAMAAGLTIDDLSRSGTPGGRRRFWLMAAALLAAAGLCAAAAGLARLNGGHGENGRRAMIAVGAAGLILLLPVKPGRGGAWALLAALLIFGDGLTAFDGYFAYGAPDHYDPPPPAGQLALLAPARLYAPQYCGGLSASRHLLYPGLANVAVRGALNLQRPMAIEGLLDRGLRDGDPAGRLWLGLLRVAEAEITPEPSGSESSVNLQPAGVPLAPVAWLAPRWTAVPDAAAALAAVSRADWRPSREAILEGAAEPAPAAVEPGALTGVTDFGGRITMTARCPQAEALVLGQTPYPGWQVYWQGRRQPLRAVDYRLAGAVLSAGEGRLNVVFQPLSVRLGMFLTLLGLGLATGWAMAGRDDGK
jgi:hypothetical protein